MEEHRTFVNKIKLIGQGRVPQDIMPQDLHIRNSQIMFEPLHVKIGRQHESRRPDAICHPTRHGAAARANFPAALAR